MILSLFFYVMWIALILLLAKMSLLFDRRIYLILAYAFLFCLYFFRYNIGNDYSSYVMLIAEIENLLRYHESYFKVLLMTSKEPLFIFLIYIFEGLRRPEIYVIGIYSMLTVIFLFRIFDRLKIHVVGLLLIFITEFVFVSWDQVRQSLAILILLDLITIPNVTVKKFLFFIFFGLMCHYSFVFVTPFFLMRRIKLSKYVILLTNVLFLTTGLSLSVSEYITFVLIPSLPFFDSQNEFIFNRASSLNYQIRVVLYTLVWTSLSVIYRNANRSLANGLFFGNIIFICAFNALNIMRIGFYFTFISIVLVGLLKKDENYPLLSNCILIVLSVIFLSDLYNVSNVNGCVPYMSWLDD